jgi:alpha,alpha-trehalase
MATRRRLTDRLDAVIFDTDGVITDTAAIHAAAWTELFDDFLDEHARATGQAFVPFSHDDYLEHVDGKLRYDGVAAFLDSRGISLEWGEPTDPVDRRTVCGLGNRKNSYFLDALAERGVKPMETTLQLAERLQSRGIRTAAVSASENCAAVLDAAGAAPFFDVRVDGIDARELSLPGKPDPALFLEAAARLGVEPARAAVVEDAEAGVEAGRRGGFGLVVGVDRTGRPQRLREHGADVVVSDLAGFDVDADHRWIVVDELGRPVGPSLPVVPSEEEPRSAEAER